VLKLVLADDIHIKINIFSRGSYQWHGRTAPAGSVFPARSTVSDRSVL